MALSWLLGDYPAREIMDVLKELQSGKDPVFHSFCYLGDEFWQQQYQQMCFHFSQKRYTEAVVNAIQQIGDELAKHFPIQPDDINELPNEVIIND